MLPLNAAKWRGVRPFCGGCAGATSDSSSVRNLRGRACAQRQRCCRCPCRCTPGAISQPSPLRRAHNHRKTREQPAREKTPAEKDSTKHGTAKVCPRLLDLFRPASLPLFPKIFHVVRGTRFVISTPRRAVARHASVRKRRDCVRMEGLCKYSCAHWRGF